MTTITSILKGGKYVKTERQSGWSSQEAAGVLATAKRFVEEGAYVFITGRHQPGQDKAATEIGENVTAMRGDVCNLEDAPVKFIAYSTHDHREPRFTDVPEPKSPRGKR